MRYPIVECDGCGKNLYHDIYYHDIQVDFRTWIKDPNTNQSELDASMCRKTQSMYCNDCYDRLISYMEKFTIESDEMISKNKSPKE